MSFSTDTHMAAIAAEIADNSAPSSALQPLIKALIEFHRAVPTIKKTGKAQYGQYADLETVLSTVTPCLLENGLVVSQGFEPSNHDNNPILVTQLLHVSGAKLISRLPMVVAGRGTNPLHDWGSSCTYSRRYSLLSILGLTADMDVDGNFADDQPTANGVAPCEPAPVKAKPSAEYKRQPTPKEKMNADPFFAWTDRISKLDAKTDWPAVEIHIRQNKDFDKEQRATLLQKLTEAKASALAVKP